MLPPIERRPRDTAGILSLQEERLGLAVLESEDLAVAADVEFSLFSYQTISARTFKTAVCLHRMLRSETGDPMVISSAEDETTAGCDGGAWKGGETHFSGVYLLPAEGIFVGTHDGRCGQCVPLVVCVWADGGC